MTRTSTLWRDKDEDLPDIAPGAEYERVIVTQKFVVLHQIIIQGGSSLLRLQIGAVADVPFELVSVNDDVRRYRPKDLDKQFFETCHGCLVEVGAAVVGPRAIAISPRLEVWCVLRNEGSVPTKPRAALVVQEEA